MDYDNCAAKKALLEDDKKALEYEQQMQKSRN